MESTKLEKEVKKYFKKDPDMVKMVNMIRIAEFGNLVLGNLVDVAMAGIGCWNRIQLFNMFARTFTTILIANITAKINFNYFPLFA